MNISGPRVTEHLVKKLLGDFNVNLGLCGIGTHLPLSELVRQLNLGELELVTRNADRELHLRRVSVNVRVLNKLSNLSFTTLHPQTTIFHDGSSIQRHSCGLIGIHSNLETVEETARKIVIQNLGQSVPEIIHIKSSTFSQHRERNESLTRERSAVWYELTQVTEVIHFDLIIPKKYYKEEYIERVKMIGGKVYKTTYFGWRPVESF